MRLVHRRGWGWRMDSLALAAVIFAFLCGPALGQQIRVSPSPIASSQPTSVDEPYSYPKIILGMGVVIGLIFVLKWGAGKVAPGMNPKSGKSISILSRLPMGPKQQLMLIKVGRRVILVGNSGGQMNSLCQITDPDELAQLIGQVEGEKTPVPISGPFASLFKKREKEFEPSREEIERAEPTEEDDQIAQLARRELLGLTERVRGLSKEMNGV